MSLEKQGFGFVAYCDFCNNDHETDEDDFVSAIDVIKRAGWKVFKEGGEWFHKCADCISSENEDDFEDVE